MHIILTLMSYYLTNIISYEYDNTTLNIVIKHTDYNILRENDYN